MEKGPWYRVYNKHNEMRKLYSIPLVVVSAPVSIPAGIVVFVACMLFGCMNNELGPGE